MFPYLLLAFLGLTIAKVISKGKNIIFVILGIIVFLAIELAFGRFDDPKQKDEEVSPYSLSQDFKPDCLNPELRFPGYVTKNGLVGEHLDEFTRATNGFPPSEIDKEWVTICCFGGSTTYCTLLNENQTWPSLLERDLNRLGKTRFNVVNHGIPGHNTKDLIHNLNNHKCNSDYIVVYQGWNDMRMTEFKYSNHSFDSAAYEWHIKTSRISKGLSKESSSAFSKLIWYEFLTGREQQMAMGLEEFLKHTYLLRKVMNRISDLTLAKVKRKSNEHNYGRSQTEQDAILAKYSEYMNLQLETLVSAVALRHSDHVPKIILVPQVMNFDKLSRETIKTNSWSWMPGVNGSLARRFCEKTNEVFLNFKKSNPAGIIYVDALSNDWKNSDFKDIGHFSVEGCQKFSDILRESIPH